jgi:hypothetical protein
VKKLIGMLALAAFVSAGAIGCADSGPSKPATPPKGAGTPPPAGKTPDTKMPDKKDGK